MYCEGYPDERFRSTVSEDLHCPICRNVLMNPKQCQENEHHFCEKCITGHLARSRKCPLCQKYLSVKCLKKPSRYIQNNLDVLDISCENEGCQAVIHLGELESHIKNCDHSLITCTNHGCNLQVKRKDKECHEQLKCNFRVIQCAECIRLADQLLWYRLAMISLLLVFMGYCLECFMNET